jgi:FdhD protein
MSPASRVSPATACQVLRVDGTGPGSSVETDLIATEEPLEIELAYERRGLPVTKSISITMRTPGEDRALAAGFLFTEGVIRSGDDFVAITATAERPNVVNVQLRPDVAFDVRPLERHFYTTSSCGVCGKASIEALRAARRFALPLPTPVVTAETIHALPSALRPAQNLFEQTGGLHAAALFDCTGKLLAVHEDVGRHNAVDKVIGAQVIAGRMPLSDCLLFVSGRASFELMQKALMAGLPMLAAVGAPSSLAVDLAREAGATLLGFVRDGRFNIYAGAGRLALSQATASLSRGASAVASLAS